MFRNTKGVAWCYTNPQLKLNIDNDYKEHDV